MEHALILVASTCIDVAIRIWMKDKETYITNSVLDITKLVKKIGCDVFEERHLQSNIDNYISHFAEQLYSSKIVEGVGKERGVQIIQQLLEDIMALNLSSFSLSEKVLNDENLCGLIAENSNAERNIWSEKEQGVYNNLVRFSSDAITNFVIELPTYSADAIKVLYQNNSEAFENILGQLDKIIKILDSASGASNDYREFETDYMRDIFKKNKKIEIFGSGLTRETKRYDISTSYIELSCLEKDYEESYTELSNILQKHTIFWISGEAGSGKTTFVQWLTTQGISDESNCLQGLIPVFVKLRNCSFPFDLEEYIQKDWKLTCPGGWIKYLIKYDKILLLLDGLDEISRYDREYIYSYVEDLIEEIQTRKNEKQIKSKIVLTTRPYVEDPLNINHGNYKILRMNNRNIEKFVYYWHRTIIGENKDGDDIAKNLIENIKKSSSLKTIAGTPLLCAMICALNYVSNETIPTNRNELYEKCCQMLIEDRDKERRIESNNEDLKKLDYTKKTILLAEISLYMLKHERVEMEKSDIVSYIRQYIANNTIICSSSIKENPAMLLNYLVQRTGIIREPAKERIDYIHKTFMEYLGAKAIIRNMAWNIINENLINPFWKETIIMCFNQMNQNIATKTLKSLLETHAKSGNEELLFMASLCAQNASEIKVEISNVIDEEIKKLIPPSRSDVDRLVSAGTYIIPFLVNKKEYSEEERFNCLLLLDLILQGNSEIEAIRILESYLLYEGSADITNYVAHLLLQYSEKIIKEYDIGYRIYKNVYNMAITKKNLVVCWDVLYLFGIQKGISSIEEVTSLTIQNKYGCEDEFIEEMSPKVGTCFWNVSEIRIEDINNLDMIDCIRTMPNINKISLQIINERDEVILEYLGKIAKDMQVRELEYDSKYLNYICNNDFVHFRKLKRLKLIITSPLIEFEIYDWNCLPELEQVEIEVNDIVYWELIEQFKDWETRYPNIEFVTDSLDCQSVILTDVD